MAMLKEAGTWLVECSDCQAVFQVKWEWHKKFNQIEYCPFCGEKIDNGNQFTEDPEDG